jgi:uncharacterized repeat protein (TIGR03837 family)
VHTHQAHSWDIFCRVVDNFGDAGVCWRLARQLAAEHGERVRLWIDELESLRRLNPEITPAQRQTVGGVEVRHWQDDPPAEAPAEIVVEAFGCGLHDEYVRAMAHTAPRPLWIVLEYLSAELWVSRHHGLPSPHPRWPLDRYFFFPGFVPGTGGLLREPDLLVRRDRFGSDDANAFWRSVGHEPVPSGAMVVSVFAYPSAPLRELLRVWEAGERQTICALPKAPGIDRLLDFPAAASEPAPQVVTRGSLELRILPFLPQSRYDELLWASNCNFVRGEDSFVRAQWAARPLVWQLYPQENAAHFGKLDAFLALYAADLPAAAREAAGGMMRAWNQVEGAGVRTPAAWAAYASELDTLLRHGRSWADRLASVGDLAGELVRFGRQKLK